LLSLSLSLRLRLGLGLCRLLCSWRPSWCKPRRGSRRGLYLLMLRLGLCLLLASKLMSTTAIK